MKTPDLQKWAKTFDLMHRVDKRRWHWLQLIAEAARKDSFWEKNIRSPEKLRKHINNGNLDKFAPNEADVMSDTEFEAQCKTNTGT